jgi:hypothetical protein
MLTLEGEEYINAAQLAERVHLSEQTLAVWRLRGFGPPYIKAGARVLYSTRDVSEWLESRKRVSTSGA